MEPGDLDIEIRRELLTLPKGLADKVAVHLVAAGQLIDSEPERALEHARYARQRAPRIPSVREANGLTAYLVGEWNEALAELRAVRRMAGGPGHLAMMADCERAMGRPERAVELSRSEEATQLDQEDAVELRIVAAGARRDLGEIEASVVSLQMAELDPKRQEPWSARLFYAYADNLLAAGREREAFTWFVHAANADDEDETDAAERLEELAEKLGGPDVVEELVTEAEAAAEIDDDIADDIAEIDNDLDDDLDDEIADEIDDEADEADEQPEAASTDSEKAAETGASGETSEKAAETGASGETSEKAAETGASGETSEKAAETGASGETSEKAAKSDATDADASNAEGDARAQ
ncbi:lipopolysaccharide assembly protein LapB [Saccharopolyspora sp. ASAGF58]|uniref:tetratricopeptide repeat protein n=1 Tax=Saccharopolyspora sp. ASAGF58 TaxID=2719023 RepID=UPI0014400F02|nr:tetratricopeptide repeat protein [Saccharopolyspora sp. ASAGF58]QIZ33621.1 tetratricopeptide repeat protein [Saccharopolyspora sp. ASAGF58]